MAESPDKKTFRLRLGRMKAKIPRSVEKQIQRAGLILLFVGEVVEAVRPDERRQADVLTLGLRTALPPSRSRVPRKQWHWEFVTPYSGATVLDFHEVPSVACVWMANHP
jgi:hypothetical protein